MSFSSKNRIPVSGGSGFQTKEELAEGVGFSNWQHEGFAEHASAEAARQSFGQAPYLVQLLCGLDGFAALPNELVARLTERFLDLAGEQSLPLDMPDWAKEGKTRRLKLLQKAAFIEEVMIASLEAGEGENDPAGNSDPYSNAQIQNLLSQVLSAVGGHAGILSLLREDDAPESKRPDEKDEESKAGAGETSTGTADGTGGFDPSTDPSSALADASSQTMSGNEAKPISFPVKPADLASLMTLLPVWKKIRPFSRMLDYELFRQGILRHGEDARHIIEVRAHDFVLSGRTGMRSPVGFWDDVLKDRVVGELLLARCSASTRDGKQAFRPFEFHGVNSLNRVGFRESLARAVRLCATSLPLVAFGSSEKIDAAKKWVAEGNKSAAQLLEEARQQAAARNGQAQTGRDSSKSEHPEAEVSGSDGSQPEGARPERSGTDTVLAERSEAKSVVTEVARISVDELLARLDRSDPAETRATEQKLQELVDREIEKTGGTGQNRQEADGTEPDAGSGSGDGSALEGRQSSPETSDADGIDMLIVATEDWVPDASRPDQVHVRMASVIRQDGKIRHLALQDEILGFVPGSRKDAADPELYHADILVPADAIPKDSADPIGEIARLAVQPQRKAFRVSELSDAEMEAIRQSSVPPDLEEWANTIGRERTDHLGGIASDGADDKAGKATGPGSGAPDASGTKMAASHATAGPDDLAADEQFASTTEQSSQHGASVEAGSAEGNVLPASEVRVWRSVPMRIGEVRVNRVIILGDERPIQQRMHNHERKEDPDTRIRQAIGGKPLPLLPVPDLVPVRSALLLRYPHLESAIDAVLNGFAGKPFLRIEPTLLVGPPGSAKTSLAEDLCHLLGIPSTVFDAGGNNDGMVFGISRKWSNAAPGLHMDLLVEHRIANPAIVIDEIEKVGNGYRNTNPLNLMLGLFEPRRARHWYDPFLETPLVMSHFSWIATANSVEPLSLPLRNRMRIITCPLPTAEHMETIAQQLLTAIYEARNMPEIWREPLTAEELEIIGHYWPESSTGLSQMVGTDGKAKPEPGGSIRDLYRYVEGVLNARELAIVRC